MPRDGKTSITVDDETYSVLEEHKPDGVTWDRYLQILYGAHQSLLRFSVKSAEDVPADE